MAAKDKWVIVDHYHRSRRCHSNVGKSYLCGSIGTEATEVEIVQRRLGSLVQGGSLIMAFTEAGFGRGIPCYASSIDVEQSIAGCNFFSCSDFLGAMGEKLGQVVLMDLFGSIMDLSDICKLQAGLNSHGVFGSNEDVFEQTFLVFRDVGKPTTHFA